MALTSRPHLAPTFKKEYSYTSTSFLCLDGILLGEISFFAFQTKRMLVVWNMGLVHLPFIKLGELYEV
jgi:hypothetical protein